MAQLVEHMLGKHEVPGPNPGSSSNTKNPSQIGEGFFVLPLLLMRTGAAQPPGSIRAAIGRSHPPPTGRAVSGSAPFGRLPGYPGNVIV